MTVRTNPSLIQEQSRWYAGIPRRVRAGMAIAVLALAVWMIPVWALRDPNRGLVDDMIELTLEWAQVMEDAWRVMVRGR